MTQPRTDNFPPAGSHPWKELVYRFEQAWQSGTAPRIEDYWPAGRPRHDPAARECLEELVRIDLEYRWRRSPAGPRAGPAPPRLEDYVARYPELGPLDQLSLELIGQEYEARQSWGDRPGHADYAARFPRHGARVQQALRQIDAEMAAEFAGNRPAVPGKALQVSAVSPPATANTGPPVISVAALTDALRRYPLLTAGQQDELARLLQGRFAGPMELARELLRRQWLTPYQLNQLLQGRGPDLVLGPYLLLDRLGEGGAGQVFKARHLKLNRVVALKVIRKELLADAEVVGRFSREFQVLSRLDHANVVHAYDAGLAGAMHFLAMEFVEGTDLGKLVKQGGPMPVAQACEYIRQAALGLQHAHERGLVHRDIKPHNLIMSVRDGLIKVADLGLARLPRPMNAEVTAALSGVKRSGTLTPENAVVMMGTADYLAPEQALNFHAADIRADIYSLGCTFFYLLTGQPPFPGSTLAEKLLKHQQVEPPALEQFRQDLPAGLSAVVRQMLAKRPEERYQTPGEVAAALGSCLQTSSLPPPRSARRGRRRLLVVAAGFALLLALPLLLFFRFQPSPLDPLDPNHIPPALRLPGQPKELVAVLAPKLGAAIQPFQGVTSVAFSTDGRTLICGNADNTVRWWHFGDREPRPGHVLAETGAGGVTVVSTSDGKHLMASGIADYQVTLWDVAGPVPARSAALPGPGGGVRTIAIAADGKALAFTTPNEEIQFWDLTGQAPKVRPPLQPRNNGSHVAVFAPDGRTLAIGSDNTPVVRLWSLTDPTPREIAQLEGHTGSVLSLAYSADSKLLASGGTDRKVRLWSVSGSNPQVRLQLTGQAAVFAPDGKTLALADDRMVECWNLAAEAKIKDWLLPATVTSMVFAPDSRHLAVASSNGAVYIFRLSARGK